MNTKQLTITLTWEEYRDLLVKAKVLGLTVDAVIHKLIKD